MSSKVTLCALMLGASLLAHAESRVRTVPYAQHVLLQELDFDALPGKVAIDGDFSIVIRNVAGGRVAHLWQRDVTGQWASRKTLLAVQTTLPPSNDDVVMANGVAALRIGNLLHIFERSGDTYLESDTSGTPEGAPGMYQSLEQGRPVHLEKTTTIADGLAAPFAGEHTLAHVQHFVDDVILVSDDEIIAALRLIMERSKLMVEPSGAAAFAALLHHKFPFPAGGRVVCVLSGGNVDRSRLKEIL